MKTESVMQLLDVCYDDCEVCMPFDEGTVCKVVKVIDGDTVHIAFCRGSRIMRTSCRLCGIDTPEMHSHDAAEKAAAIQAKQLLEKLLLGKMVTLTHVGVEKFGRALANVLVDGQDASSFMLQHSDLCRAYDGDKKLPWDFSPIKADKKLPYNMLHV